MILSASGWSLKKSVHYYHVDDSFVKQRHLPEQCIGSIPHDVIQHQAKLVFIKCALSSSQQFMTGHKFA
jgi:hypothetical protein